MLLASCVPSIPYVQSRLAAVTVSAPVTVTPDIISRQEQALPTSSASTAEVTASASIAEPTQVEPYSSNAGRSEPTPDPGPLVPVPPALPTRLIIPAISVDAPIVPIAAQLVRVGGASLASPGVPGFYAAGWYENSAPLGVAGNTVLNGHNTGNGEVFRDLYTLERGDEIVVYSGDVPYAYPVSDVLVLREAGQSLEVRRGNARYIEPADDERLTRVTCHPDGSLRYRLIVIAWPVVSIGSP